MFEWLTRNTKERTLRDARDAKYLNAVYGAQARSVALERSDNPQFSPRDRAHWKRVAQVLERTTY